MKTKVYKDGCRCVVTEYDLRAIDEFGDCQRIEHFDSVGEAEKAVAGFVCLFAGVVIEKHIQRSPGHLFAEPDTYVLVHTYGDKEALRLWGA